MKRIIIVALCSASLLWVHAQENSIPTILEKIKQNNKTLQAYYTQIENELLQTKLQNALEGVNFGAYYMPFGDNNTGVYTEYEVTQSFHFPSVYLAQKSLVDKQKTQLNTSLLSKEQAILLEAKHALLTLVYLNKRMDIERERVQLAQEVFKQVKILFDKEQVGILSLNKAKVSWLQEEFKLEQTQMEKESLLKQLTLLNGGNPIVFNQDDYLEPAEVAPLSDLWQNKANVDPELTQLNKQAEFAQQQIKVSKNQALPDITIGYNHQGIAGAYYNGFYGGLSLPLWNAKRKVEVAKSHLEYQQAASAIQVESMQTNFERQYEEYLLLLNKFKAYESTLSNLNSDALLLKAYQLGELSFLEYYMELKFYHEAIDTMLEMEKELYQIKAQLLKHQL